MTQTHETARLEAFCDGVFAIALTLLVIDLKVPESQAINSTEALWRALQHVLPSVFAFVLSFIIVIITWLNHHNALKLVHKSSSRFAYANGFLLLTVVFIPFPTALLGRYVLTDWAAPAVVIYNVVLSLQALGWVLIADSEFAGGLLSGEGAVMRMRLHRRRGYSAMIMYGAFAFLALKIPFVIAIVTTATWLFWLVLSFRGHESMDAKV